MLMFWRTLICIYSVSFCWLPQLLLLTTFMQLSCPDNYLWLRQRVCKSVRVNMCFCNSHLQFLLQFSSVIPSSSSPQTSTAEKISATSTAKQHTRAKITMHFCWDCKKESTNNIDYQGAFSALQYYCKNKAKVPRPWTPPPLQGWLPGKTDWVHISGGHNMMKVNLTWACGFMCDLATSNHGTV